MHSQLYSKTGFSILLALLLSILTASHVALAQEENATTSSTTRPLPFAERQASTTDRREAVAENIAERQTARSERQAALSAERQQRVLNLSANLSNRLDAAINRFYNIIARIESRIGKLKAAGMDTTAAEAELRTAAGHLANAKVSLSTIDTRVQEATTSTEPQNRWMVVRETYQAAGTSIRACHQSLRATVSLLKTSTTTPATPDTAEAETATSTTSE